MAIVMRYNEIVNSFVLILLTSGLAGAATIVGLLLVLWKEHWTKRNSIYIISLAAGVLVTTAMFHLLPEAVELGRASLSVFSSPYFFLLLSFGIFYVLEQVIIIHTCAEECCDVHSFGIVAAIGIAFHSLLDGIIIGIGFEVSYTIGIISALAVLLHELPEGIFTLGILLHANVSRRKAVLYTILVAIATPLGAVFAYLFMQNIPPLVLGNTLAVAAGSFLYIGASDLIPQTHRISRKANIPLVLFGGVFIILVSILIR